MSSTSLLNLLSKSQNVRSRSVANMQSISPSFAYMNRSSSSSLDKVHQSNTKRSTQLYKIMHMLNVKFKQTYFYAFCRLEQMYKSRKAVTQKTKKPLETVQESFVCNKTQTKLQAGLQRLMLFQQAFISKQQLVEQNDIKICFQTLQRHLKKVKLIEKIQQVIQNKQKQYFISLFTFLKQLQKEELRTQVLAQSCSTIIMKVLRDAFDVLKRWQPAVQVPQVQKIKLKQKQINCARPIPQLSKLFTKLCMRLPKEDNPIDYSGSFPCESAVGMRRLLNIKTQPLLSSHHDLSDNCCIFNSFPSHYSSQKSTEFLTFESGVTQQKQQIQAYGPDDVATQRLAYKQQRPAKSPSSSKYKSTGYIVTRHSIEEQEQKSPLVKVETLLKNMQSINSIKSAEKQKKMVNVNLSRNIYDTPTQISAFTPLKERKKSVPMFNSENKQNFEERLITERAKLQTDKPGGMEATKHKSTVLLRDRRSKVEKNQQFTARKMKIEIENIINRRNKQLTSRQLK